METKEKDHEGKGRGGRIRQMINREDLMKWQESWEDKKREQGKSSIRIEQIKSQKSESVSWKLAVWAELARTERGHEAAGPLVAELLLTSISLRTMSTMLPITTRASNTFQASPK